MGTLRFDVGAQEKFLAKVDELAPGHAVDRMFRSLTLVYTNRVRNSAASRWIVWPSGKASPIAALSTPRFIRRCLFRSP